MEQQCGRKIELRLTKEQERTCVRSCAAARRAYNWKLAQQNAAYDEAKKLAPEGTNPKCSLGTPIDWHKEWVLYKHLDGNEWLMDVSKCCGQEALRDLGTAWKRFFTNKGKHPQFRKYGDHDSFRMSGGVFIGRNSVQLPKLGRVKLKENDYIAIPDGVDKPKVMVIETLKPKNMSRNRKLASSILDANVGRIHTQLEYKCRWHNIQLVKSPQFYASSQYCSDCGCYKKEDLKLTDREWTCPHCGFHHDRDVNAARNLRFYGLWLYGFATQQTAASYAVEACPCSERCTEGSGSEPRPRDLRLQFFETEGQCRSLKQEITQSLHSVVNG